VHANLVGAAATVLLLALILASCGSASGGASSTPQLPPLNGAGRVAIIHEGAGPAPTQSLQQAEMGAWLCQSQLRAIEPLVPRIPSSDTKLRKQTDELLAWFHAKCTPDTPDMTHEFIEVFHELSALTPPTPAVPRIASVGSVSPGN
jgi:hypothetical protein